MLFNSFHFFVFFPVVTIIYFLLSYKYRWMFLLAASCYFYMVFVPYYIFILAGTIVIDYFAGIIIEGGRSAAEKKRFLLLSLAANIGVLAVFKYYNFFTANINQLMESIGIHTAQLPYLGILLPIGLSFHTFQAMSYTIEVYRGNQKAERNFIIYALYVMFYPQLVAGPIERPQNVLPQFHRHYDVNYERISAGLKQMVWGFFKKIVIADRLAVLVNHGYSNIEGSDGLSLLVYTYFFAFQIYCDFSGYSDIAIGAAKVMGIDLMENFRIPYVSRSVKEFWERWHISLSTWFRDYLYIPLGGNRVMKWRWYYNLFIVFLVSGFWHGANWTYIVWGILHGTYLITGLILNSYTGGKKGGDKNSMGGRMLTALKVFITFNVVSLAWIFFRAESVSDAVTVISRIGGSFHLHSLHGLTIFTAAKPSTLLVTLLLLILFICIDPAMDRLVKNRIQLRYKPYRIFLFAGLTIFILLFGHFGETNFIYFQF
jgi:D-alanyl-lipoteichoic acid acyltransferase DltB (MBOAT superfamily)